MSSIKTTQIDGDVSVGRNVAIGGTANIAGSVKIGHSLKVNGWLDAPNIKGTNKGVFLTVEALRTAYPNPHDGWFAGVGASTPFSAYIGNGGEWVATGGKIEVTADMSEVLEEVKQLQEDVNGAKADIQNHESAINTNTSDISNLKESVNANTEAIQSNSNALTDLSSIVDSHNESINKIHEWEAGTESSLGDLWKENNKREESIKGIEDAIQEIENSKGYPNGIATLDEFGRIPYDQIAYYVSIFINVNSMFITSEPMTLSRALSLLNADDESTYYKARGTVITFLGTEGKMETYQYQGEGKIDFSDVSFWTEFGGASSGGCYNVTAEREMNNESLEAESGTYDTKQSAIEYAISKKAVKIGTIIIFSASATTWQSYQYVGLNKEEESFSNLANWIAVGGQTGDESVVNINLLCRDISEKSTYTLSEAIEALTKLKEETSVDYVKPGMVMTYRTGEAEWETKQLIAGAADYTNEEAWNDFGGNGNSIVVKDIPEKSGVDAFSTGGAYERLISNFIEDINADGTSKMYQAVNADGKSIGDPIVIPLNQGGGGSTTVNSFRIVFENNPLYASAGGNIIGRMAARSYTQEGDEIIYNKITSITISDATTGVVLSSKNMTNENSSSSLADYKFELDFSDFFDGAGSREFTIRVTDQLGNVRSQNITVVAVDVTVEITKPLHECIVNAGSGSTTLDNFYRFEKNALKKDGGIDAMTEILWQGEWKQLGEANVRDTFTKSISLNPSNLFGNGESMSHGSYLIRIHGYAPNAKVTGNYAYTSIMCIDENEADIPVVAIRYDAKDYDENLNLEASLYDVVVLHVAAYTGSSASGNTEVSVYAGDDIISTFNASSSMTYMKSYQIQGYKNGDTIVFKAIGTYNGISSESNELRVIVNGSAIDVMLKDGAAFGYDFALRTNSDTDKTISDNGITMELSGVNWSSNGFSNYLGENCLRIAENVTAKIGYRPFGISTVESSGLAVQFAFATRNIKNDDAMLMKCYDPNMGVGWYVKGNVAGIFCAKGEHKFQERKFRQGEKITMAVVVEPSSIYRERNGTKYSCIKMYLNGEEVACIGYTPDQSAVAQNEPIVFDGTDGDFYLYYIMAYQSHYEWAQAFNNYLAKLTDVDAMMREYMSEDVLNEIGMPSLDKVKSKGMPYYVVVAAQSVFDTFDNGTNTSENFKCTLYYFNPDYPCLDFKATNVRWRRQGTTSAKRPVKNDRFYLAKEKDSTFELLHPDDTTELGRNAIALGALKYTLVRPDAIPVQIITVKVDYSDSSNANDCGVCDLMNATFRALGSDYMTPAQRAYSGTFTKGDTVITDRVMNHSTRNHPIVAFRATSDLMTDAWFHAKANWKEDKGEQVALGFQNTPGYNLGCLNYGDFIEYFGTDGETLDQIESRFKADSSIDTSSVYLLSLYCGRDYRIMRYVSGAWSASTGSMKQINGKWVITGDVLNPVSGYELLSYQGFCWWMGVSSVSDMMEMKSDTSSWVKKLVDAGKISTNTFPAWTAYFECMIDDDQLQIDLALGKKVPYELYRMLKFCNDASYASGIDTNGRPIVKTGSALTAWKTLWANDLWKYASPHSLYAYTLFTDYLAATDQRAKNMQPMFFLEDGESVENGVYSSEQSIRMYLNKVYDCDTCNGKDNDGGCTVDAENDPNKASSDTYTNPYSGWGSVLFNNVDRCPTVYLDATHSTSAQLNLKTVCAAMRSQKTTVDGVDIIPFSPEGAKYFFVEKRLMFWKKLISSYDGEHKYIEPLATSDAIYFYALQGLGLTSLPQFIEQRWRIRDGYYQTGNFFSGVLSGRIACASSEAKIHIKAAKTGYFGVGHDASGNLDESVFLEAGEEYDFTKFSHTETALLYIYQADRMSEIDLSEISIDATFNFSVMSLVEKIKIGSENHSEVAIGSYTPLSSVVLNSLPFLRILDLRNTSATSVDASGCPRIEELLATGTSLMSCTLAETSPIHTLSLPSTLTELRFINLPELSYPGGLTIEDMTNVTKFVINGCPKIDKMQFFDAIIESGNLKAIGLHDIDITASVTKLQKIVEMQVYGLDEHGNDVATDKGSNGNVRRCSGLSGRWILTEMIDDTELASLQSYFPLLSLHNAQYTMVMMNDIMEDPANVTNMENGTSGDLYVPSGHILRIRERLIPVTGKLNTSTGVWEGERISNDDYRLLSDGTEFDYKDELGSNNDAMMRCPRLWYKGINDFKNQKKYICWSSLPYEPISTSKRIIRKKLSDITLGVNKSVMTTYVVEGESSLETSGVLSDVSGYNVYEIDVEGMKQVRWPGLNNSSIGAVFINPDGIIMKKYNMAVSNALFDFVEGDYIFIDVPDGAKSFVFTSKSSNSELEAIAVDSVEIEAIEPDWVLSEEWLGGIYQACIDGMYQLRSISGAIVKVGNNKSETSSEWKYDADGKPTNLSISNLNFTVKDFQNISTLRGNGYQLFDYEMSKLMALLYYSLTGNRDAQLLCGYGRNSGGTTGYADAIGNTDSYKGQLNGNKCLGFESFFGCTWEPMDNVAVNVPTYAQALKDKMLDNISSYPIDAKWHIFDPITKTERVVQGITTTNYAIARTRHGRFCDVIASKCSSDSSVWATNYCDGNYYAASRCRCVGRSSSSASAGGGLSCASANGAFSSSYSSDGARLAFRGAISVKNDIA